MTDYTRVETYYDHFDEWARLDTPSGRLEFERSLLLLDKYLPRQGRVLDLGGGPGRYSIALAQRGHRVVLADLSERLLQVARQKIHEAGVAASVECVTQANATDLGRWPHASFDAVVAFGPFYHLTQAPERLQAAREAARVLKNSALLLAAFIPHLSGLAGLIFRAAAASQVSAATFAETAGTGTFRNLASSGFQEGCYLKPAEMSSLLQEAGLLPLEMVSLRGIAYMYEPQLEKIRQQDPALHTQIVATLDATSADPAVVALCGHAVCVARKCS